MSGETAKVESDTEESPRSSVLDLWQKWYDLVGLAGIMVFMLWVRAQSWQEFLRGDQVLFAGNDAYYHFREISYVTRHWPSTMPFDPWSAFPYGTSQGQFGTLYDQLVGTAAMVIGLGSPSEHTVAMVTLLTPPVLGALVAIPVYYMGRRMHNRVTGLFAALLLAVMPGEFLRRSTVGFADHQVAEVFFLSLAVLALMVALSVSESELPVYEQVIDRDWEGLKRPVVYAALAGVATVLYMWVWPPGVILVGILGIFFTVGLSADYLRGRSPEHVALVGVVSMAAATVLLLPLLDTFGTDTTRLSMLHVFLTVAVLAWCLFLAAMARVWDDRNLSAVAYPVAVFGIVVVGIVAIRFLLPGVFSTLYSNALRSFGFGQSATSLTIAEAQPTPGVNPLDIGVLNQYFFREYGLAYVVALLSLAWLAVYTYYTDYRSELLLLLVWTVLTWLMALTQRRFHYYLVIPLVLLTAWTFGRVISMVGTPSVTDRIGDIKPYQVLTLVAILLLVFAPLFPPLAAGSFAESRQTGNPPFVVAAGESRPSGAAWASTGDWMQSNTPDPEMDYYGQYERTDDFEYPEPAYGVMAWWDYGHWITVLNERMPHANPFQENARSASSFFQADTERRANAILDAIPGNRDVLGQLDNMTTDEIAAAADGNTPQQDGEDIRYVMIDDQTAGGKFLAVRQWSNPPGSNYFTSAEYQVQRSQNAPVQNVTLEVPNSRFQDSLLYELYYENADGLSHYRLVHASNSYSLVGGFISGGQVRTLNSVRLRGNGWTGQLANLSSIMQRNERASPRRGGRRAATTLPGGTVVFNASIESSLKVFERVPGATISGRIEGVLNETTVVVELPLETGPGRPFTYRQQVTTDSSGRFEITVPYPTDDAVGPAGGGTDTNVTTRGNYSLYVGATKARIELFRSLGADLSNFVARQFDVSERAIYDGATVDLGTVQQPQSNSSNESSGRLVDGPTATGSDAGGNGVDAGVGGTPSLPVLAAPRGR